MKSCIPDRQWQMLCHAVETKTPPQDKFLGEIYNVIVQLQALKEDESIVETPENRVVLRTLALINNPEHRYSVMAYFLSGATVDQIAGSLRIEDSVVDMFGRLIIDMSEIKNKLELRDYARQVEQGCPNEDLKKEIQCGYLYGPNYLQIYWKHGNESVDLKEKDITKALLLMGFEKGMLSRNTPINSADTKEALKWSGHILRIIPVHNSIEEKESLLEEAILAIKKRQGDVKEEIDPADIIH